MYGMSREGVVPRFLGKVHAGRRTPWAAILFTASIAGVLAILGDLPTLADTTVLLLLLVFVTVHVSLLVLRRTPVDHEHFRAPTVLPWLGAVTCAGLAIQQVAEDPKLALWAGGLLLFGLILWFVERAVR
jgi:amino acid transporter